MIVLLSVWAFFFLLAILIHLGASLFGIPHRWKIISKITRSFSIVLRALLRIRITLEGDSRPMEQGGYLLVANHLGYLDGFVLGSLFPVIYVSKKEVRRWPLMGQWTALVGTIYIDRERRDKTPVFVQQIAQKLQQRNNVLIFPEGTSTHGERLLPFQTALFAAPLIAQAPVVPLTLAYERVDGQPFSIFNRDQVCWYGDMEFVGHFWNLLALKAIEARVQIHSKIETARFTNGASPRKQLAQECYEVISRDLNYLGPSPPAGEKGERRSAEPAAPPERGLRPTKSKGSTIREENKDQPVS